MSKKRYLFRFRSSHPLHPTVVHWNSSEEMHDVLHKLAGPFRALMLELLEQPMSKDELQAVLRQMEMRMGEPHKRHNRGIDLDAELLQAVELGVLEKQEEKYALTLAGREMAEHIQEMIPFFFEKLLSEHVVSLATVLAHVLLSILKVAFGVLSNSAGLLADGIDNTADTLSSVLVWVGITFNKQRLASIFIVVMMFGSVGGVALASYQKVMHPEPVAGGGLAFFLSAGCGLLMLGLSAYQYLVGKRHANFALMCQAVDSRNHVLTSSLVCGGIVLSLLAERFQLPWLYYADAAASGIIGLLILQSAVELANTLVKPEEEAVDVSHFMRSAQERLKARVLFTWISEQIRDTPLSAAQLEERFAGQFCEQTPKILTLSGLGYHPESNLDLHQHLEQFVQDKKLMKREGTYILPD